jgi:hypothetical protein
VVRVVGGVVVVVGVEKTEGFVETTLRPFGGMVCVVVDGAEGRFVDDFFVVDAFVVIAAGAVVVTLLVMFVVVGALDAVAVVGTVCGTVAAGFETTVVGTAPREG